MPDLFAVDVDGQARAVGSTTNAYAVAGDRRDLEAPRPAVLVVRADFDLGAGRELCGGRDRHVRRSPMLGPNQSTMPDLPGIGPSSNIVDLEIRAPREVPRRERSGLRTAVRMDRVV